MRRLQQLIKLPLSHTERSIPANLQTSALHVRWCTAVSRGLPLRATNEDQTGCVCFSCQTNYSNAESMDLELQGEMRCSCSARASASVCGRDFPLVAVCTCKHASLIFWVSATMIQMQFTERFAKRHITCILFCCTCSQTITNRDTLKNCCRNYFHLEIPSKFHKWLQRNSK